MELVSFAKDVMQNIAEQAAGYRLGQTALRHLDRALWVVEKCAKWAVPPPLDQDERPQPELVRPLPWVFFLMMLVTLRVTRECVSLLNLVLGKPPLRSTDVVMYIQSKRRYLRTLKYQGNRIARARSTQNKQPWYSGLQSLFEFTMCFRRSHSYGNNNTTRVSNNDEVLVVKRSKRTREPTSPVPSTSEATMERLIERMMVELDADSDDDSSYTLTNPTSLRSDHSEYGSASDDDTLENLDVTGNSVIMNDTPPEEYSGSLLKNESDFVSSTPEKPEVRDAETETVNKTPDVLDENMTEKNETEENEIVPEPHNNNAKENALLNEESPKVSQKSKLSPKTFSTDFLQNERCQKSPQKSPKFANGRMNTPSNKKGLQTPSPNADRSTKRPSPSKENL